MSHFLLFQLLKPLLLNSAKESNTTSRVVTVSSSGHRMVIDPTFADINFTADPTKYTKFAGYGQSKTANVYLASAIHRRYGAQGLTALSLHPGGIQTELGRHLDEEDIAAMGGWDSFAKIFKSPEQGAATTVWAAVSPYFEDVKNGGYYLSDVGVCGPIPPNAAVAASGYAPHVYNEANEENLWKISSEAVGVPSDD